MIASIIGLVLAAIGLTALALQRFYSGIPAKELKRLAARGDTLASSLYRAVAYGGSLRLFLWMVVSSGITGGVLLLAQNLPAWAAFLAVAGVLVMGFVVLQSAQLTVRTAGFAAAIAPVLGTTLGRIEPVLGRITHHVHKRRTFVAHSGLYEKEDLSDLLDQQKNQSDNRISHEELELARRALYFDDTQAADAMVACPNIKTLKASDAIGPILLEELYKSGQRSFVVYDAEGEQIVGIVQLQEALNAKQGGKISGIMNKDLAYAHEDFSLRQVMDVCLKTGQPLVLVINAFEELVGVISLESLIHELFDVPGKGRLADLPYQDRATVAAYKPLVAAADSDIDTAVEQTSLEVKLDPPEINDQDAKTEASSSEAPEVVK